VKEEKIFLTAKQSEDANEIANAVLQIIRNCTFGAIDVESLPAFDVEFLFLQLRAKSVNNVIEMNFECRNFVRELATSEQDDRRCHSLVKVPINLDEIVVSTPDGHNKFIMLLNGLLLEMKYPSLALMETFVGQTEINAWIPFIAMCIRSITDSEGTVYEAKDYTQDELVEFVENMGVADLEEVQRFFATMPSVAHSVTFKCNKCNYEEAITLRGLETFFP
jgi:hypothetical protein